MRQQQDAFGRALLDTHLHRGGCAVIERDDGYVDSDRSLETYFAGYAKWARPEQQAVQRAKGRVLDIGAGAGRHSLYLQNKGLRVTAIDVSPAAVELCRLRGIKDARVKALAQLNAKDGKFDTVLMLGNNFGLFGSFNGARRLLKKLASCTSADAQLLAEILDPYKTTDPSHLAYHKRNRRRGRMGGQLRIRVRYKQYVTPWFDYLFVSEPELRRIVAGTGWEIGDLFRGDGPTYFARLVKTKRQGGLRTLVKR